MNHAKTLEKLKEWLKTSIPSGHKVLIPISGGSDSALCFMLCSQIAKDSTLGVYIGTDLRQRAWFEGIGNVHYGDPGVRELNPEVDRWAYFLSLALSEDRILIGSRNLTENTFGTYSTASKVASFFPLGSLWKHEIMELCEYLNIPKEIIESSSRADPECGRPAELAAIPFRAVDAFLQEQLGDSRADLTLDQRRYLEKVYRGNSYKAALPLIGPSAIS